jgi:hypothetical protein
MSTSKSITITIVGCTAAAFSFLGGLFLPHPHLIACREPGNIKLQVQELPKAEAEELAKLRAEQLANRQAAFQAALARREAEELNQDAAPVK